MTRKKQAILVYCDDWKALNKMKRPKVSFIDLVEELIQKLTKYIEAYVK